MNLNELKFTSFAEESIKDVQETLPKLIDLLYFLFNIV